MLHGPALDITIEDMYGADEFQQQVDDSIEKSTPVTQGGIHPTQTPSAGVGAPSVGTAPTAASGADSLASSGDGVVVSGGATSTPAPGPAAGTA